MCVYQIVSFFGPSLEQARNAQLQQPWLLKVFPSIAKTSGRRKLTLRR